MDTTDITPAEKPVSNERYFFKCLVIVGMALVLWMPTIFILNLIRERASRREEAVTDINGKWADKQTVSGPVLMLPYRKTETDVQGKQTVTTKKLFIMPAKLNISSKIIPEKRHRGIYEVAVYKTEVRMDGRFDALSLLPPDISSQTILWNDAKLLFRTDDPIRGINEDFFVKWNANDFLFDVPGSQTQFRESYAANIPFNKEDSARQNGFSINFNLNGSQKLLFSATAKENRIMMRSGWKDPGFTGMKLPDTREVSSNGFVASWKLMNRTLPAVWDDTNYNLEAISVGAELLVPVDSYDKTERSVKYAMLCILLTFGSFFLIETIYKKSLHLVQYGLAGVALVLFYSLLLSIAEYLGFNLAYIISAVATIGLVTWFVGSIMKTFRLALFIGMVLSVVYTYIFTIIQMEDYSLLIGSIGLFVALGIIMYFSRKLQWTNNYEFKSAGHIDEQH